MPIEEPRSGCSPFFASTSLYFVFGRWDRRHQKNATAPINPTTLSATATPMPAPAAVEIPLDGVLVAVGVLIASAGDAVPVVEDVCVDPVEVGVVVVRVVVVAEDGSAAELVLTATFCTTWLAAPVSIGARFPSQTHARINGRVGAVIDGANA